VTEGEGLKKVATPRLGWEKNPLRSDLRCATWRTISQKSWGSTLEGPLRVPTKLERKCAPATRRTVDSRPGRLQQRKPQPLAPRPCACPPVRTSAPSRHRATSAPAYHSSYLRNYHSFKKIGEAEKAIIFLTLVQSKEQKRGLARRPDPAPLAGPALSSPAPREWHRPSGRVSHGWRERIAQCRNMCTQLGPSPIITERGRHYGAGGQPPHTSIYPMRPSPSPYSQRTWNSVKPPLFPKPTAAS
jgi:hypothetical protein